MTILWEFDEKHPKQVSAYGTRSWVILSRPYGTGLPGRVHTSTHVLGYFQPSLRDSHLKRRVLTQTLKPSAEPDQSTGIPSTTCRVHVLPTYWRVGERRE